MDMNAFFASVEQLDRPELRGKPVAVTNGEQGTCIITCSYEARAYGIHTGMRLKQALVLCPRLIRCPSRPQRYVAISRCIMRELLNVTPDIEVFSVDEAFLDVTHCQKLWGTPELMGRMVKQAVTECSGLTCSVGVSGDKTTAKFAAQLEKPDGFTVILPWQAKRRLANVPVTALCGIGPGISRFLARYGVYTCGDMQRLPIGVLAKRFGNLGRRLWYMCQGADPDPVHTTVGAPKSMGHGKVIPPNTTDRQTILRYLLFMSEKLAARLRRYQLQAQWFFAGVRCREIGWCGAKSRLAYPSHDARELYQLCERVITEYWHGEPAWQVQLTALDPQPIDQQLDLWRDNQAAQQQTQLHQAIDTINERYGAKTLTSARLLGPSSGPDVISPAWKPSGHRQTISKQKE